MNRLLAITAGVALMALSGVVVAAQDAMVELDVTIDGEEQVLELDPADGPVQGVIVDVEVIEVRVEGIVAIETEDGWEMAPKSFVAVVGPGSPLYGLEEGDSWVIAPSGDEEDLDG